MTIINYEVKMYKEVPPQQGARKTTYCSLETILSGGEISPRANPCEVARTASHAIARPHQLDCEYKHT